MKFAAILKGLLLLTAASLLAACGGGSSGGDSAFQPPAVRITATPTATTVQSGQFIDVAVKVTQANGANVADSTVVNSAVTPASHGLLQSLANGELGGSSASTVGGVANFRFTAAGTGGNTTLTFSVANTSGSATSTTVAINVTPGPAARWRVDVELIPEVIPSNGRADVRVGVFSQTNNQPVADGTTVSAVAFPASRGAFASATSETVGGYATFVYQAQSVPGNVEFTFSVTPEGDTTPSTGSGSLTIAQVNDNRLKLEAARTTLPVNQHAITPFLGSPYMSEVTITVKDSNGQPVNCTKDDANGCLAVSINPVGNTGGFTTLDDPETECKPENNWEGCEFHLRMGKAPLGVTAGKATVFVHSLNFTGKTTLTVTYVDRVSSTTIAAAMDFEIVAATSNMPSQLGLTGPSKPIYVNGSGGNSSGMLEIKVMDSLGQPVPDPQSGSNAYNNYRLEIVGGSSAAGAARLSGIDAAGNSVTGQSINLPTTAGVGGANFIAGNDVGSFVVRLTADRADNNVDNGISDPVVLERSVVVSDGRLFDLEITQPVVNALTINPYSADIEVNSDGLAIPPSPDATYSVTVAVIATDRLGNPVLPGTEIRFGMIDEPQATGVGDYYIAGGDGNPREGGTLFTAATGRFLTAGGGVGPGDTLVVMGEEVIGNQDLESARIVTEVHSRSSLSVDYRFNHNDTTGQSVDYGGVLPYIIGRSADGNITATATTNDIGVAVTKMNYPVSKLGKLAVIWAQGDGPVVGGQPKKVTDVEFAYFAGVAPARLVVSPAVLPANTTRDVTICVYDALSVPMGGISVDFAFQNLIGAGSVDNIPNSGTVANLTSFGSGCTTATVRTSAMLEGEGDAALVFAAAGATGEVTFSYQPLVLLANPSAMSSGGRVTLTLLNGAGEPQPGFQISGACTSSGGAAISLSSGPGVTDSQGRTTAVIDAFNLNQVGGAGSGVCTFATADGSATATVTLQGQDVCGSGFSPPPAGCPTPDVEQFALSVTLVGGPVAGQYAVSSSPSGVTCTAAMGSTYTCSPADFDSGAVVTLTATEGPTGGEFNRWEGDCQAMGTTGAAARQARVTMSGNRTCRAVWGP